MVGIDCNRLTDSRWRKWHLLRPCCKRTRMVQPTAFLCSRSLFVYGQAPKVSFLEGIFYEEVPFLLRRIFVF